MIDSAVQHTNRQTYNWVYIAKGIGISLVVMGHFCPATAPEYWHLLKRIIYLFHMPLFFFLSGFLFRYEKYPYLLLVKKKVKRLLIPFVFIAVIFLVVKYVSGLFFNLDNPVKLEKLFLILLDPLKSFMPLLWFIYTLFLIFLIYPPIRSIFRSNLLLLCLFLFFNVLGGYGYPVVGSVVIYMPYFISGVFLCENRALMGRIVTGKPIVCFILVAFFILMVKFSEIVLVHGWFSHLPSFIFGIFGAVCVVNISLLIDSVSCLGRLKNILYQLGFYSMTIYLFHTLFESAVRILFYQVLTGFRGRMGFEFIAFCAIGSGIVFPMVLEKFVLRKVDFTRRYLLGLA